MFEYLQRLIPYTQTHLLLTHPGLPHGSGFAVGGIEVQAGDEGGLELFAVAQGFPSGWAADMLAEGAMGLLAVDAGSRAVLAMGGYTGLQSYTIAKIEHPRSRPPAGRQPRRDWHHGVW